MHGLRALLSESANDFRVGVQEEARKTSRTLAE